MQDLYLVTHPESTHHIDRLVGGGYDAKLTAAGTAAAGSIATALRNRIPAGTEITLYSSDLQRTLQTAHTIGDHLGVRVIADRGLREKSYGIAEGKPQAWLDERFIPPPLVGERMDHDEGISGAETKQAFARRVYASMDVIGQDPCEHQIVVTHGGTATIVIAWWIRMPVDALGYVNFRVTSGGITHLREDDYFHNRQVVQLNDVTHLQ
jgi:2,3-bisphosphoglycerate-dependent phosphoglycerate mutase